MNANSCAAQLNRIAGTGHNGVAPGLRSHVFQHLVLFFPIQIVERRDPIARRGQTRRLFENAHDPIGGRVRQRVKQNAVDETENRRVGPDAHRQRKNRNGGEARRAAKRAKRVPHVLPQL